MTILVIAAAQAEKALRAARRPQRPLADWTDFTADPGQAADVEAVVVGARALRAQTAERLATLRRKAPRAPLIVTAPRASSGFVRAALMNGATDVVLDPARSALLESLESALEREQALSPLERVRRARERGGQFQGLVSRSERMWDLFETCVRVAPSDATVLILGETGTGKERLARAIHSLSRRPGAWVALNCGGVPATLVESTLFGHEKGAFTGAASSKPGLFRRAEGGTLFLDEVGNLPLEAQHSLLRTLQENSVRPVGGHEELPIDVRVVAATNAPLEAAVEAGAFREDLLYRLDVIRLVVPPLRERPEDVLHLFGHFSRRLSKHHQRDLPELKPAFTEALVAHDWPGNVRELENFVERLILTHRGQPLGQRHFASLTRSYRPRAVGAAEPAAPSNSAASSVPPAASPAASPAGGRARAGVAVDLARPLPELTAELERRYLEAALARQQGRIQATAKQLGISRRTLLRWLEKHGIDKRDFR